MCFEHSIKSTAATILHVVAFVLLNCTNLSHHSNADELKFNRDVRPILARNCFACHGMDESTREADLRLDDRSTAIQLGAILPGDPRRSELMVRILSEDPEAVMPPPDSGHRITDAEIQVLRQWLETGAKYEKHWSFTPPGKSALPTTKSDWDEQPIDTFVLARLEETGLEPNLAQEPSWLLRRLSLDLTGLPPTLEEADRFLADNSPQAYEDAVDRLLQSDAFGEHWARMWLDLARYADTKGYEKDRARTIWRYRDWVIDAFNQDLPYDQFTVEQLAGDLLENPSNDQLLATAFHRNTMENEEGGTDDEEFRVAAVKDRVDTTMQVWMGLTMGCAKCHSHKYDPISQSDYYSLYAFFNQTQDADREAPILPTPTKLQQEKIDAHESHIVDFELRLKENPPGFDKALSDWLVQFESRPLWAPLRKVDFISKQGITLEQNESGTFSVTQELPEKDSWSFVFEVAGNQRLTALRIETDPKSAGGKWPDKNVVINELVVELLEQGREPAKLQLKQARADFSQKSWEVDKAIDGKSETGWAFSPKAAQAHCAVFELSQPLVTSENCKLRLSIEQQYGQGLVLDDFRILASTHAVKWLDANLEPTKYLEKMFRQNEYP
ncbi:MAG: DUF1549 domain-containing protein [Planctomycetota bacterium]